MRKNHIIAAKGKKIGIIGGGGLLGSNLREYFSKSAEVDSIEKDNYDSKIGSSYDVLINANGNSKRFWANIHPFEDFEASTRSVHKSLFDFTFKKYIYFSSIDVYLDHSGIATTKEDAARDAGKRPPYSFHKWLSEQIVRNYAENHLILRLSVLLGRGLRKGIVYDLLHDKPLFVTPESRLQHITTEEVARVIQTLLDKDIRNETFNVGGHGAVSVSKLMEMCGKSSDILENPETQAYEMNMEKLGALYPLKTSEEYILDYLRESA